MTWRRRRRHRRAARVALSPASLCLVAVVLSRAREKGKKTQRVKTAKTVTASKLIKRSRHTGGGWLADWLCASLGGGEGACAQGLCTCTSNSVHRPLPFARLPGVLCDPWPAAVEKVAGFTTHRRSWLLPQHVSSGGWRSVTLSRGKQWWCTWCGGERAECYQSSMQN